MENIKKKVITYIIISLVSFFAGLFFNQIVLSKYFNFSQKNEQTQEQEVADISFQQDQNSKKLDIVETCNAYVDVSGAVKEPGVYCLDRDSLVIDAVKKAGGFKEGIAIEYVSRKINLSLPIKENEKLYFPFEKEVDCQLQSFLPYAEQNSTVQESSSSSESSQEEENSESESQCVNINTASESDLTTLNGVGEVTAQKIIQGRPYQKIEDLLNVSGIGDATYEKFKNSVCI